MTEIMTMGEMIVEIMREKADMPLDKAGVFKGPYPSGAPAIFIDTVARLGHGAAIVGGVGDDDFGKCLTSRLEGDGVDCSDVLVQLAAVKSSVNNIGREILKEHLTHCIIDSVEHGDDDVIDTLNQALDQFMK